jgi:hypothetical protein
MVETRPVPTQPQPMSDRQRGAGLAWEAVVHVEQHLQVPKVPKERQKVIAERCGSSS